MDERWSKSNKRCSEHLSSLFKSINMIVRKEVLLFLSIIALFKQITAIPLSLGGRSFKIGKYRLRPVIVYKEPEYKDDAYSYYPENQYQGDEYSEYPQYEYYSENNNNDYNNYPNQQIRNSKEYNNNAVIENFKNSQDYNAVTAPPTVKLTTKGSSPLPAPTPTTHRFNRGQKEVPLLRPPVVPVPEDVFNLQSFESSRIKPKDKAITDLLSAELDNLKSATR